jgi:PhzF family phenazine biosynthesis protein
MPSPRPPIVLLQIDAFTNEAFAGNPAAVCLLPAGRDASWMLQVAREMNLPETAFVVPTAGGDGFDLRWFTPTLEVDLCGHATLAAAHALWQMKRLAPQAIARFHTKSGLLTATRRAEWIELDFPATVDDPCVAPAGLADALGVTPIYVGRSRFDYLVQVDREATVRELSPDLSVLRTLPVRGVIVTAAATTPEWDFVSRFFAPAAGIDEDPVTGSAHCTLAPFWGARLGKSSMVARQVSLRGGTVRLELDGARVRLSGQAVTILRGELTA